MTTAKNNVLLGYNMKICIYWGELTFIGKKIKIWWGGGGGGEGSLLAVGGGEGNERIF